MYATYRAICIALAIVFSFYLLYNPNMWQGLQGDNIARISQLAVRLLEKAAEEAVSNATIQLGPEYAQELKRLTQRSEQRLIPKKLEDFEYVKVTTNDNAPF